MTAVSSSTPVGPHEAEVDQHQRDRLDGDLARARAAAPSRRSTRSARSAIARNRGKLPVTDHSAAQRREQAHRVGRVAGAGVAGGARRRGWPPRSRAGRPPRPGAAPNSSRRTPVGQPDRPGGQRLLRRVGRRRLGQPQGAELADRLEHPVADAPAVLDRRVDQRLVDQRLDEVGPVTAEQVARPRRAENPSWNTESQARARCSSGAQQVPRPGDHRGQGLVPGRAPTGRGRAAARSGRRARGVPRRRTWCAPARPRAPPRAAGRPAGRRSRPRRASGSSASGRTARARRRNSSAPSAAASWLSGNTRSAAIPSGARLVVDDAEVAGGHQQEGDQRGHGVEHVLAVVEHEQRRDRVELLGDPGAHVGLLRRREGAPAGHRVPDAQRRADLGDDVVRRGDAHQLDEVHPRLSRPRGRGRGRRGSSRARRARGSWSAGRCGPAPADRPGPRHGRAGRRRRTARRCAPASSEASSSRCTRCSVGSGSTPSRSARSRR